MDKEPTNADKEPVAPERITELALKSFIKPDVGKLDVDKK